MRHRYFVVYRNPSGATAFEEEVTDFRPLYHDVAFRAVCAGTRANDGAWGEAAVEPVWCGGGLSGVTVRLDGAARTYSLAIFADQATELLVARNARDAAVPVKDEERPRWAGTVGVRHASVEGSSPDAQGAPARRRASVRRRPYPLVDRSECAAQLPRPESAGCRLSLFVASDLLADLKSASAESLEEERADFLIGYVVREGAGTASVVVLDRIPADADTTRSPVHFGFSPQTFAAAQRALEERDTDQAIVGWHHNHPPPCGRTCLMTIPACATENVFFSVADRTVHRRGFDSPYMVALVTGKGAHRRADDPVLRAFGWRNGMIRERTFTTF
jgi:hypothetical protein